MYMNTVAKSVRLQLYLRHFYNIIFKIKHKLYKVSVSAPSPPSHQKKIVGVHLPPSSVYIKNACSGTLKSLSTIF